MSLLNLTEEHELFRASVKKYVDTELRPKVEEYENKGLTPNSVWKRCGELGFLGIPYPEQYGGMEADYSYSYILHEELAKCGSPGVVLGLAVQTDMSTPALEKHGSDYLKEKYLAPAIAGDMVTCIAVSEPDCGSDVAGLKTRAVLEGDHYVINGRKMWITNGSRADYVTLLARTSDEPGHRCFSLFVVPTDLEGFSHSKPFKKTCYLASDTVELILDNVRVPKENLIGHENMGFIYQMEQFQYERLAACCQMVGGMKRCYDLTKQYIKDRIAFGVPLAKMQVTRHKMAQMISEISAVDAMTQLCVVKAIEGGDFTKEVSMLKIVAAQTQQRVLDECVQLHGGMGLMQETEVARYFRDSKLAAIGGGSTEVMKEIIAKIERY